MSMPTTREYVFSKLRTLGAAIDSVNAALDKPLSLIDMKRYHETLRALERDYKLFGDIIVNSVDVATGKE